MSEVWNVIQDFLGTILALIFGKIVKDSLPKDMGIKIIYAQATKYLFRLFVLAMMLYSFISIKLFTPSEKQKLALVGTYAVLMLLIALKESKGEWKLVKTTTLKENE